MNFFLSHALISLKTAPKSKNIFLMIIEKHTSLIKTCFISHQATHFRFKYYISKIGGGVKTCADLRGAADIILERSLTDEKCHNSLNVQDKIESSSFVLIPIFVKNHV